MCMHVRLEKILLVAAFPNFELMHLPTKLQESTPPTSILPPVYSEHPPMDHHTVPALQGVQPSAPPLSPVGEPPLLEFANTRTLTVLDEHEDSLTPGPQSLAPPVQVRSRRAVHERYAAIGRGLCTEFSSEEQRTILRALDLAAPRNSRELNIVATLESRTNSNHNARGDPVTVAPWMRNGEDLSALARVIEGQFPGHTILLQFQMYQEALVEGQRGTDDDQATALEDSV